MLIENQLYGNLVVSLMVNQDYVGFLTELKLKIRNAQIKAAQSVNHELVRLYWDIGNEIIARQKGTKWGSKFLENLARDLQSAFPGMKGFSIRNLKLMRQFAQTYSSLEIGQQPAAQLPWFHIVLLMQRIKDETQRNWYADQALKNGWSRSVLELHIEQILYERQALSSKKISNFQEKLAPPQSDLAEQTLKNPYVFDFLTISEDAHERDIENGLTKHITKFLLELGKGFSFVGTQVPINVGGKDYFIDMLFYHLILRNYVVIELKVGEFKPEHAGKLNFYLTAVDKDMRHESDNPSIGMILCKNHDKIVAEYALENISTPIGISKFELVRSIPQNLKSNLPTIEELEYGLNSQELGKKTA